MGVGWVVSYTLTSLSHLVGGATAGSRRRRAGLAGASCCCCLASSCRSRASRLLSSTSTSGPFTAARACGNGVRACGRRRSLSTSKSSTDRLDAFACESREGIHIRKRSPYHSFCPSDLLLPHIILSPYNSFCPSSAPPAQHIILTCTKSTFQGSAAPTWSWPRWASTPAGR